MTVLAALDITKAYGERVLLAGVSLTLEDGQRVGVVGRNGAGKSTLAKILAGAETPDTGSVATRRGARPRVRGVLANARGALARARTRHRPGAGSRWRACAGGRRVRGGQ